MGKLTLKQRKFLTEYVKTNGNGTQSALRVYDTKDSNVAHNIASENLQKPTVKEELQRILEMEGNKLTNFTNKLSNIAVETPQKGYSGADIVKANEIMLKLHGVLTDKRQITSYNINADLSNLSKHELVQLRNKKKLETDTILEGEEL